MKNITEMYDLPTGLNENLLTRQGFSRNGSYKAFVYKDIIQLIIQIHLDEGWWGYQVYDVDTQTLYSPYYVRDCGRHLEVEEIDKNINKIMKRLVKTKIFKEKKDNGKPSSKV